MTHTRSKKNTVARPAPRTLGQRLPAGVESLLGGTSTSEPAVATASPPTTPGKSRSSHAAEPKTPPQPVTKDPATQSAAEGAESGQEPRVTLSLRYGISYRDRLDALYLREKAKDRNLRKTHLVEEALEDLFAKYGLKA